MKYSILIGILLISACAEEGAVGVSAKKAYRDVRFFAEDWIYNQDGSVTAIGPRYRSKAEDFRFWNEGYPFPKSQPGRFQSHRNSICIMMLGAGAKHVRHEESSQFQIGDWGVVISNGDGKHVTLEGKYEFKPLADSKQPGADECKFISSITCSSGIILE
ncbi:MAG: hypothetical protein AABZ55_07325 [Bdellovibrionota bacterium]